VKDKPTIHINEKELGELLNLALLDLDAEKSHLDNNALEVLAENALNKRSLFSKIFTRQNMDFALLVFSLLLCLNSFFRHYHQPVELPAAHSQRVIPPHIPPNGRPVKTAVPALAMGPSKENGRIRKNTVRAAQASSILINALADSANSGDPRRSEASADVTEVKDVRAGQPETMNMDSAQITAKVMPGISVSTEKKARRSQLETNAVKSKTSKRHKRIRFHKNGTFKLKNGRYGTSK
jgi:hypothetical protein